MGMTLTVAICKKSLESQMSVQIHTFCVHMISPYSVYICAPPSIIAFIFAPYLIIILIRLLTILICILLISIILIISMIPNFLMPYQ